MSNLPIGSCFQVTLHKNKILYQIAKAKMTILKNTNNNLLHHASFTFEFVAHFGRLHELFQNYKELGNLKQ